MKGKKKSNPRSSHLTFRLFASEKQAIEMAAERAGLTPGSYVRQLVLKTPPPRQGRRPPIERQELARMLGELGKIGSNVNQLAREHNSGEVIDKRDFTVAVSELRKIRDAILTALGREA